MKKLLLILLICFLPITLFAQYKNQTKLPSLSEAIAKPSSNLFLGFIDFSKISMNHHFSMSYMTMGKGGMMVNTYMNTINYQISNPLFLRLNLGLMNSPYNSFNNPALDNTKFIGGAELFYRPTENSLIKLGIDVRPGYYGPGSYYYDDRFGW